MFYIIENNDQFEEFTELSNSYNFVYPILGDNGVAPQKDNVIALYVYSFYLHKSFIVNIDHPDCTQVKKDTVFNWVQSLNEVITVDAKRILKFIKLDTTKIVDLLFQNKEINNVEDRKIDWYYSIHSKNKNVNKIIPISLLKGYYDNFTKDFDKYDILEKTDYSSKALYVFDKIESTGLTVNTGVFKSIFPSHDISVQTTGSKMYAWFNIYNSVMRPTYKFNNINFSSLNKSNGVRDGIIADVGCDLVEFDFRSYHLYILAEEVGFVPEENLHRYLAKHYFKTEEPTEEQYNKSKGITFKAIYTEDPTYNHIEYIRLCKEFKHKLYNESDKTLDIDAILPIYCQRKETIRNVDIMYNVLNIIDDEPISLLLYTYDSMLFNVSRKVASTFAKVIDAVCSNSKYPVRITKGSTYGHMTEV